MVNPVLGAGVDLHPVGHGVILIGEVFVTVALQAAGEEFFNPAECRDTKPVQQVQDPVK